VYHDGRQAHLADIRNQVLVPLRDALTEHFEPLVTRQRPLLSVDQKFAGRPDSPSVLEPAFVTRQNLQGVSPRDEVFARMPPGLLADVRKHHYQTLFANVDGFLDSWTALTVKARAWVSRLAKEILGASDLPAHPDTKNDAFVMHFAAAIYIYRRLCDLKTEALDYVQTAYPPKLQEGTETLALGRAEDLSKIRSKLDEIIRSKDRKSEAMDLIAETAAMHRQYTALLAELDMAISSQRLRGQCDLVPFF
jgi:hypothetical protein